MATQRVGKAKSAERLSDAARTKLCAEWDRLDGERLEFDRQARSRADGQKAIQARLEEQRRLDDVAVVDLARWEYGVELVDGSFSYKDELVREIGFDEFERRKSAVPQREKFFLRAKDKPDRAQRRRAA